MLEKIYLLPGSKMKKINEALCAVWKTTRDQHDANALKKVINDLAQLPRICGEDQGIEVIDKIADLMKGGAR